MINSGQIDKVSSDSIENHAALIWSVADLLRSDYEQSKYGRVIRPLVVSEPALRQGAVDTIGQGTGGGRYPPTLSA
jgi:hypothetical protein